MFSNHRVGQRFLACVFLSLFTSFSIQVAHAQHKQTFPKIGGYYLAGKNYDDPDVQRNIARLDVAYLGMFAFWNKGNQGSATANQRAALQAIRRLNPDIKLFNYSNLQNARIDPDVVPFQDIYAKVENETGPSGAGRHWGNGNNDWWLRRADGSFSDNAPYAQNRIVNPTSFVTPDSNGDRYPEWLAKRNADVMLDGIPEWDGIYTDTVRYAPLYTADYDGDGDNDAWDDKNYWAMYRRPFKAYWDQLRVEKPGIMLTGNIGSWAFSERSGCRRCIGKPLPEGIPEFWRQLNGGLMEAVMGRRWSYEYWGKWEDLLGFYHRNMEALIEPKILLINVHLDGRDTETSPAIPKLQLMRYGFATTLMGDGYYAPSRNEQYNDQMFEWFDEFDLAGTSDTEWMGLAIDPPQREAWSKGVYRRDFENAIALVNPKGNGTKTVTIEPGFSRILGTQDPVVNNGKPVTTITLKERDGIVLVRTGGTVPRPNNPPPTSPPDSVDPGDGNGNGSGDDSGDQGGNNGGSNNPPVNNPPPTSPPDTTGGTGDNGGAGGGPAGGGSGGGAGGGTNNDQPNTKPPETPRAVAPSPPVIEVI